MNDCRGIGSLAVLKNPQLMIPVAEFNAELAQLSHALAVDQCAQNLACNTFCNAHKKHGYTPGWTFSVYVNKSLSFYFGGNMPQNSELSSCDVNSR